MKRILLILIFNIFTASFVFAEEHIVDLVVNYKTVNFANAERQAIAVNDQIPGPTLHFKEGDHIVINVHNQLNEDTAIHWHGMLVPWQMDGVFGVTQRGIPPGGTFKYEFTLEQSGTYWYHAHAGLQEQQGLYGAFIIDPVDNPPFHYTKDFAIVLSDWSNTNPDRILANLKKEGDYYSPRFPLQPSLAKFIHDYRKASKEEKKQLVDDYKMMQQMRMSIYDISDVAYDTFLLNGHPKSNPWTGLVKMGDIVRLRFIGAGGSSIFRVKIPESAVRMVHIEGNDVIPYAVEDFTVAPGETYDVLVRIEKDSPYIIYAESTDTVGAAYGALVTSPDQMVNYNEITPFPEPLPVTREMMDMMMGSMGMSHSAENHKTMNMSSEQMTHQLPSNKKESMPGVKMNMSSGMDHSAGKNQAMDMSSKEIPHEMSSAKKESMSGMNMSSEMSHSSEKNRARNMSSKEMSHEMHSNQAEKMPGMDMNNNQSSHSRGSKNKVSKDNNHAQMQHDTTKNKMNMSHGMSDTMDMSMPTEPAIIGDKFLPPNAELLSLTTSPGTKYQNVVAVVKTNDPDKPIADVINMELFGYMERFIWFINGEPEHRAKPIILEPNKRYRMVFTNNSMMHHPMHIHGHWFILRNGNGAYDPLLHTIDVPPGATIIADVDTDASGQWLFHCHFLYHMESGMTRIFQYSTLIEITKNEMAPEDIIEKTDFYNRPIVRVDEVMPIDLGLVKHPMPHPMKYYQATYIDIGEDPFNNAQRLTYEGLYGGDYNKLQLFINDAEVSYGKIENADIDVFYWHLLYQFWAIKGGANYVYRPTTPYWQPGIGIEGVMPYFIDTDIRLYYHNGSAKLDIELSRDTQITNNFLIRAGIRGIGASKTVEDADIGGGLNQMRYIVRPYYRLTPGLDVFVEYEHEQAYGPTRNLLESSNESASSNTITFGLAALF